MTRETNRERMERRGREPVRCPLCDAPEMHPSHLARHMRQHGIDRRQPNAGQTSLFPVATAKAPEPTRRRARPATALCSQHQPQYEDKRTPVIRFKGHLYWAEHNADRWDGRRVICRASSATLCVVPAADGTLCACQTGADDGG
jgi:hypothetical protein